MKELINVSSDLVFSLTNSRISYVFQVSKEGILEHLHFGGRVNSDALAAGPRRAFRATTLEFQGVKDYNLSAIPQEYSLFGTSDVRHPSLHVINSAGNSTNTLLYHSHEVLSDKPALQGLPSARGVDGGSETLRVRLKDEVSLIEVDLFYTIYQDYDLIARSNVVRNIGHEAIQLNTALSSSIDLPPNDYEFMHFKGTWSRELNEHRMPVAAGKFVISSAAGTSSNLHNPFAVIMEAGASEASGNVIGTALVYSGNFAITVEQGEFDDVRISAGINPFNFNWQLNPGESFATPESLQVFSAQGLNGMSQVWHRFVKNQISPTQHSDAIRPTYLNSWEAAYFDINEQLVSDLADKAKAIGLEMLVVDDGWFEGRNDDHTSLGDWFSDKQKFPNGIAAAAAQVKKKGLKFGLWFEPEMVNEQSQLFESHPDWVIHVPGRVRSTGRQQLILDLSRAEVVAYLFERIDSFLGCGDIDYVKWDMNRVMSEVGSAGLAPNQQLETPHRYMLGVYDLVGRLVAKHPNVLFENCASGGNRFDLGMLNYMAQSWLSDMSEPIGRLPIVNSASYLYPPSIMASYIGPVPGHQNNRQVSIKTRAEVGFFCAARGLSLNIVDIERDQQQLCEVVELYKATAHDVVNGSFYRLRNTDNEVCWQLSSSDGNTIYVGYFHILSAPNLPYRRVKLVALDDAANYSIAGSDKRYAGNALMNMGLDLPYVHAMQFSNSEDYMDTGDFSSRLFVFEKV